MSGIILNCSPNQARAYQYGWSGQPVCSGHLLPLPSKAGITSSHHARQASGEVLVSQLRFSHKPAGTLATELFPYSKTSVRIDLEYQGLDPTLPSFCSGLLILSEQLTGRWYPSWP